MISYQLSQKKSFPHYPIFNNFIIIIIIIIIFISFI